MARVVGWTGFLASTATCAVALAQQPHSTEGDAERTSRGPDAAAMESFLDNFIGFQDWVGTDHSGIIVTTWATPFRGEDREPLPGASFYEVLGRPDLAAEYRRKASVRTIVMLTAIAPVIGGTILFVANAAGAQSRGTYIVGGVVAGVGVAGLIGAAAMDPEPVDATTARRLARDYNLELAERLGVPPELSGMPVEEPASPGPLGSVTIGAGPDGLALGWRLRF